jgi:hypothetical protein
MQNMCAPPAAAYRMIVFWPACEYNSRMADDGEAA